MKISFFLDNSNCKSVDFSCPQMGNPGVGGTQYMFSLISWYYSTKKKDTEVVLYASDISKCPCETHNFKVNNLEEAVQRAEKDKIDYFVCRTPGKKEFYTKLKKTDLKVVLWGHNFAKFAELNWIYSCENIKRYVCVGKEQLRSLIGHPVYSKSTYIYNAIVPSIYRNSVSYEKRHKSICYVGSIIETKGFDVCAKIWRKLYDNGFKMDLHIIGSGQLYNKKATLGMYNIAAPEFEKKFIHYLIDEKKELLPEVKFHGVLAHREKTRLMQNCFIGMPNPTGETETFGISAIEFEILGVPVITKNKGGFIDTVKNGVTGLLGNDDEEIYADCVRLFNMKQGEYDSICDSAKNFSRKFDIEIIIQDWVDLFTELSTNKKILIRNNETLPIMKKIRNFINLVIYKQ